MAAATYFQNTLCLTTSCLPKTIQKAYPRSVRLTTRKFTVQAAHIQIRETCQEVLTKVDAEDTALKVFADDSKGIVCYRTESGEIVCEGMDEGPIFYPPSGANFYMPDTRAAAMLPLLGEGMYEI